MKMLVLFVVFFAAAVNSDHDADPRPGTPDTSEPVDLEADRGKRCAQYGIAYHGYDLQLISNCNHWSDCAGQCSENQSCSYWTWSIENKHCFLKI